MESTAKESSTAVQPRFTFDEGVAQQVWLNRFETLFGKGPEVTAYAALFVKNRIRHDDPDQLTDQNFIELGIPIGHRRVVSEMVMSVRAGTFVMMDADSLEHTVSGSSAVKMTSTHLKLGCGFEWIDYEGEAPNLQAFLSWVDSVVLGKGTKEELPAIFQRAFWDNKPMSFLTSGRTKNGREANLFLLRLPSVELASDPVGNQSSTVATLTNRLVVVFVGTHRQGRLITFHKDATKDLPWLDEVKKGWSVIGTYEPKKFVTVLLSECHHASREILLAQRKELEMLNEIAVLKSPTQIVEMISLLNRQAQVLKRCIRANEDVIEALQDTLGPIVLPVLQTVKDLATMAEELETNAMDSMNLRMALCDFRSQENMRLFTYLSAVAVPLTVLTGWYGMNFESMEELKEPNAYWVFIGCVGFIVLLTILILWWMHTKGPSKMTHAQLESSSERAVKRKLLAAGKPTDGRNEPIQVNPLGK
jgi:hypothetical protein